MRRVVVLGFDGFDPHITETLLAAGELPNLARIRARGGYARLATTYPAQTPVAWSTFATGVNPGGHGIYDFLRRDPATYRLEPALFHYEQKRSFLPPRVINPRSGTPVWQRLADAGIAATVLRHPGTYPPDRPRGRMLSGVGVPDLRGGFGTGTYYTSEDPGRSLEGERAIRVLPDGDGLFTTHLVGPRDARQRDDARVPITVEITGANTARVRVNGGDALELRAGEWSDWLHVKFATGVLQAARGALRFHLVSTAPLRLYASPIGFDARTPLFPISHPWDYAAELEREIGTFHTLGMPEEHNALNNGRIDETAFLAQCADVMRERRAMLHRELDRLDEGLLYCLFDTPDRLQHMFWRYRDARHPLHDPAAAAAGARVIDDHYRECDAIVGAVLEHAGDDTLLLVLSDHGFTDFRREVHINAWLHAHGFLALRADAEPHAPGSDLLHAVDWTRTKAYALGMAGIYLNLRGREAEGIVASDDAADVRGAIARGLTGLSDADGAVAVHSVLEREEVYSGARVADAPDLIVNTAPGYRVSSASALGGVPHELFADNLRVWSGDHVVDPTAVPGVLFASRPIRSVGPALRDLAPTILRALGAPTADDLEGEPLLDEVA